MQTHVHVRRCNRLKVKSEKQPNENRGCFSLDSVTKKITPLARILNCLDTELRKKRSVVLLCCHTLPLRYRSAIQPRRKERSSAQFAAPPKGEQCVIESIGIVCRVCIAKQGPPLPPSQSQSPPKVIFVRASKSICFFFVQNL